MQLAPFYCAILKNGRNSNSCLNGFDHESFRPSCEGRKLFRFIFSVKKSCMVNIKTYSRREKDTIFLFTLFIDYIHHPPGKFELQRKLKFPASLFMRHGLTLF